MKVRNSLHGGKNMLLKLSKITSNCQTTIPAEIRKALDLEAGDTILFEKNQWEYHHKKE